MGPMNSHLNGALASLRMAELHREAEQARLAASAPSGKVGRGAAKALRGLADRLDPGLDPDTARIA